MSCDQTHLLSPHVDGELSPAASDRVRAHVAECRACAAELDGLQAVGRLLSAARTSYPAGTDEVMARLRLHVADLVESADAGLLRIARVFTGVAASVLVGGLWLLSQPATSGPGGTQAKVVPWEQAFGYVLADGDEQAVPATPAVEPTSREAILNDLSGFRDAAVSSAAGGAEGDAP